MIVAVDANSASVVCLLAVDWSTVVTLSCEVATSSVDARTEDSVVSARTVDSCVTVLVVEVVVVLEVVVVVAVVVTVVAVVVVVKWHPVAGAVIGVEHFRHKTKRSFVASPRPS